jgi:Holliday junction resolvasome RuvABC endonuclease subunit
MNILCLDPSLRAFGWAVISNNDVVDGGCIVTKKVQGAKVSDSDTESLREIAQALKDILSKYPCQKVIFENPIGSKSSRANQSLSFVKGLVISACVFYGVEFTPIKAKSVKKNLTDNKDASKDEILEKVKQNFKSFDKKFAHLPKFKLYAVSDAAAVLLGLEPN